MANTNTKQTRTPKAPRQPKATAPVVEEPEVQIPEVENIVDEEQQAVIPEPETIVPEVQQPEPAPEPEPEVADKPKFSRPRTNIYLVQKGEKYHIYRDTKRLSRILVSLEKAKMIAAGYGENHPTIVQ